MIKTSLRVNQAGICIAIRYTVVYLQLEPVSLKNVIDEVLKLIIIKS